MLPRIVKSIEINAQSMIVWTILIKHLEYPAHAEKTNHDSGPIRGVGGVPLTDRRNGLGVRTRWSYEFNGRRYTWDDEVTAWEEGKRIAWKAISMWTMLDSFELIPDTKTTRVVYKMEYRFPYGPFGWLLARLIYHEHMERSIDETLSGLKSSAERIAGLNRSHT